MLITIIFGRLIWFIFAFVGGDETAVVDEEAPAVGGVEDSPPVGADTEAVGEPVTDPLAIVNEPDPTTLII
ncbi:MAG: hypothetical protein KatS3mg057_0656 [Herpetosiphonaceae bacterium]|nr:MAG: hypothetical protein KatS3mg057_0656 [Herpetosiphonaceae bacterium]